MSDEYDGDCGSPCLEEIVELERQVKSQAARIEAREINGINNADPEHFSTEIESVIARAAFKQD